MDQNQPTVDNNLQKAIDDITNNTNIDPVFSDPVAAPSSVPEGDTGELGEPVGPFPEPEASVEVVPPAPEGIAPLEAVNIPELNVPEPAPVAAPAAEPAAATVEMTLPPAPEPTLAPEPALAPAPAPEPAPIIESTPETSIAEPASLNMHQIKEAALRDLLPLLDRLNMDASQKFGIYRDVFEDLRDYTILGPAYKAAKDISDDTERANALLYLIESIDKM